MRPKSMVLILIALFCGLIASIGISQVVERQNTNEEPKIRTVKIFVASADIDMAEELNAQNVKLEDWPASKVPEGAVKDLDNLVGRRPRLRLFAGDPITVKKLLEPNERYGSADQIPMGYRVMSVKVSMATSVSYLIKPGDRVDVLVFHKGGYGGRSRTTTLMRNVTVFAVNSKVTREIDDQGQAIHAKTISLLVKPEEVEKLAHAEETGRIRLSLRRPDEEVDDEPTQGFAYDDERPTAPQTATPAAGGLLSALGAALNSQSSEPAFEMQVMAGNSVKSYTWDDVNTLPLELQPKPAPPTAAPATGAAGPLTPAPIPVPFPGNSAEGGPSPIIPPFPGGVSPAMEQSDGGFLPLGPGPRESDL